MSQRPFARYGHTDEIRVCNRPPFRVPTLRNIVMGSRVRSNRCRQIVFLNREGRPCLG